MNVGHLVTVYGYWAVFLLVLAESLGVPLPGETSLVAAGIYAGHSHSLSVVWLFAVAALACITGGTAGFLIGRLGGYRLVRRYGPRIRLDEPKLKVGRYVFERHGAKIVFFGRFVSILRTYAALLAGTNKMGWRRFTAANIAGAVVWSAVYAFASYAAGSAIRRLSGTVNLVLIGVALVTVVVVLLLVHRRTQALIDVAEAAYPGPLE